MSLGERAAGRWALGYVVPGSGDLASSLRATVKGDALKLILQEQFQDDSKYDGREIAENDAKTAIKFARSKKLSKAHRKGVIGGMKMTGFVAGAATGATVGSVVPAAGTAAGGVLGGVGVASVVTVGTFGLDHLKRKTKGFYKWARGKRGEHRLQATLALLNCASNLAPRDPKTIAAQDALYVILDEEHDEVMKLPEKDLIARVFARLASN